MIIKIIYILFIGIADFILCSTLNKVGRINTYLIIAFVVSFLIFGVLHTNLFHIESLMPMKGFVMLSQFLIELAIFHFVGKYYIARTKRSKRLSEEVKTFSVRVVSFIFFRLIYVIVFLVQCMFIINFKG